MIDIKGIEKRDIIFIVASVVCFILFVLFASGTSTSDLVNFQFKFMGSFLAGTNGSIAGGIAALLSPFVSVFLSLLFLALGFSLLASNGVKKDNKLIGIIPGIAGFIIIIVAFHSMLSLFMAIAVLLGSVYVVLLANTYAKEFRRWVKFRIGSNAVGKVLMVFNMFLAIGILISVSSNTLQYEKDFKEGFSGIIKDVMIGSASGMISEDQLLAQIESQYPNISEEQKDELIANYRNQLQQQAMEQINTTALDNVPFFKAYLSWLPLVTAFYVWIILEFLKTIVFSNLSGIFVFSILKISGIEITKP